MNELVKDWDLTKIKKEVKIIQQNEKFAVLDIETTGFDPEQGAKIIQVAGAMVKEGRIVNRFTCYVNPEVRIPKKITELTGITDKDVEKGVKLTTALWMVKAFIEDAVIVCHNASFDWYTFLKPMMNEHSIKVENDVICTYRTFHRATPGLGKGAYTNEKMALLFGYMLTDSHRADADVEATAHSLMGLKRWFDKVDMESLIQAKEDAELAKEDTTVEVESVNFWEKVFGPSKKMKRQYVRIKNEKGSGTVFYDLIERIWKNKDFPENLDFKSVERATLAFLGLNKVQELEGYRG